MIIRKEDNLYIVYIFINFINDIDIFDYNDITFLFKRIFSLLKEKYNVNGFCDVDVYVNNKFGMILEIYNIYNDDKLDIKVKFNINSLFLNEINYIDDNDYNEVFFYDGRYYTLYNNCIDSNIIYKNADNIVNNGIKIK